MLLKKPFLLLLALSFIFFSCSPFEWFPDLKIEEEDEEPEMNDNFPIVLLAVPKATPAAQFRFSDMKSWGITHIHSYAGGKDVAADSALFNMADLLDMQVFASIDKNLITDTNGLTEMETYVDQFKNHPALGAWYLYDEPDNHGIHFTQLEPFYNKLKTLTPNVPVAVSHAWTTNWYKFDNAQDILMNDSYPVTGLPFPTANLNNTTRFTESVSNRPNDFFPIIQFFNWKSMAPAGATEYKGYPIEQLRYPTKTEFKYFLFSSLCQGAKGIGLYSHARSGYRDDTWIADSAVSVIHELKLFTSVVEDYDFSRLVAGSENDYLLSQWEQGTKRYLALANRTGSTLSVDTTVTFTGDLIPWGQTRTGVTAAISSGSIAVQDILPWEVLVWKVED